MEEGGGGYLGYGWDSAIWGVNVQLAYLTNNSAPQWAAEACPRLPCRLTELLLCTVDLAISSAVSGLVASYQWSAERTEAACVTPLRWMHQGYRRLLLPGLSVQRSALVGQT